MYLPSTRAWSVLGRVGQNCLKHQPFQGGCADKRCLSHVNKRRKRNKKNNPEVVELTFESTLFSSLNIRVCLFVEGTPLVWYYKRKTPFFFLNGGRVLKFSKRNLSGGFRTSPSWACRGSMPSRSASPGVSPFTLPWAHTMRRFCCRF